MATNKISPCSYVIHPEGESMLSEGAYVVSRDDEGAGEFLTVEDGMGNKVRFDLDDISDVWKAVGLLRGYMQEQEK